MTLGLIDWLILAAPPIVLGIGLLRCLGIRIADDPLAYAGWLYAASVVAFTTLVFSFLVIGAPLDRTAITTVSLLAGGLAIAIGTTPPGSPTSALMPKQEQQPRFSWVFAFSTILCLYLVWLRIHTASFEPIFQGDEAQIWAARAKALFHAGGLNDSYTAILRSQPFVSHPDYPWANPLLQAWVFQHAGEILHFDNRVPIQLAAPALVLILAAGLRRQGSPWIAALLLPAVFTAGPIAKICGAAFSDVMLTLGVLMAVDGWLRGREGDPKANRLMILGLALAVLAKNEGLLLVAIVIPLRLASSLATLARTRERQPWPSKLWLLPLYLAGLQEAVDRSLGVSNDVVGEGDGLVLRLTQNLDRIDEVTAWLVQHVYADPLAQRWIPVLQLALLLIALRRAFLARLVAPALIPGLLLLGYAVVFVATPRPLVWHLDTAAVRIGFHAVPAAALLAAALLATAFKPLSQLRSRVLQVPEREPPDIVDLPTVALPDTFEASPNEKQ